MVNFLIKTFTLSRYLTVLLAIVAIIGDYVVLHSNLHIFQAIFDNATHSLIGGLCWYIFCLKYRNFNAYQTLIEVALCALVASLIDIDHFVAARSFNLKDATNLKQRPPLHCSTFPLLTVLLILLSSYILQFNSLKRSGLIILVAFASHHTRDAARHGYWFYPLGSTPPIPYFAYVGITCLIPHILCSLQSFVYISSASVGEYIL